MNPQLLRMPLVVSSVLALAACVASTAPRTGPDPASLYGDLAPGDIERAATTLQETLETRANNETGRWRNPESGNAGAITPVATLQTDEGIYCRRYDESLIVGGREATYRQAACRTEDGRWVWVDDI